MHSSSLENMQKCYERYICNDKWFRKSSIKVIDIGGANINGTYRDIFSSDRFNYYAVDIKAGNGIDIVLDDPYKLPFEDNSIDIVLCGQVFEHIEYFWDSFAEIIRILKNDGLFFLIVPSSGEMHRYPVDCYRFYPDAFLSLAKRYNCLLIDFWLDEKGPWKDLVGVFSKSRIERYKLQKKSNMNLYINDYMRKILPMNDNNQYSNENNQIRGEISYLEVLDKIHHLIKPELYLEIGIRNGNSFNLSKSLSIGVDPSPAIDRLNQNSFIYQITSDDFFEFYANKVLVNKVDFAFIDGMHLFEFVLRDFFNIEKYSKKDTIIAIDDIFPNNLIQASRTRESKVWTGDVWKIINCLNKYRPDLEMLILNTLPTGLLIIRGLDHTNTILKDKYNAIVKEFSEPYYEETNIHSFLERKNAFSPKNENLIESFILGAGKEKSEKKEPGRSKPNNKNLSKKNNNPIISIVLVSYNMMRELPRTVYTLRAPYQKYIDNDEIEILIVDNGSREKIDMFHDYDNVRVIYNDEISVSPVKAINKGISEARSDLIGAMIDGARMLSPGILHYAIKGNELYSRAVISTFGFLLGHEPQITNIKKGYNQEQEDKLLKSIYWQKNGYDLFKISCFAGSSKNGWFSPISESNAIFMDKSLWKELEGYDENFVTLGGGLANLDLYKRACELPDISLIRLLGEGSFHQIHGGIATNQQREDANWKVFHDEYIRIRGKNFSDPNINSIFLGEFNSSHIESLLYSMKRLIRIRKTAFV